MQHFWFEALRMYVRLGLLFHFRKIVIHGRENIPKAPVIFAANHQNALLDALLIVCFNPTRTNFVARADIFKKPFIGWLLSTFNMIPIYRIRDGWQSLGENEKTFDVCDKVFSRGESLVIFPEGNHGSARRLRPLSKGFTRIAFHHLEKDFSNPVYVVPVGINYTQPMAFRSSVSVYFGEPLDARSYYQMGLLGAQQLKRDLDVRLKMLVTHVEEINRYNEIIAKMEERGVNYLDPVETNARIAQIETGAEPVVISIPKSTVAPHWIQQASRVINYLPLAIWHKVRRRIKDPIFVPTVRFVIGIFAFPLYYLLVFILLLMIFGWPAAAIWLALSAFSTWVLAPRHPLA
ncbi:MAG TPA: lysophospholipid acyltransferase family protein [Cyclobacteriaceae bacterium]|nr:lysophospholipid acyltransferase family protein [Cyclobacteriaceae bacterium]